MKKYLLIATSLILSLSAFADLKPDMESWTDFSAADRKADKDMGRTDMTSALTEWGYDLNGEDAKETCSAIYFQFENMAHDDLEKLSVTPDVPSQLVRREIRNIKGFPTLIVFFESGSNIGFTLNHYNTNIGNARIAPKNYKPGKVYSIKITNAGLVRLPITSSPEGAAIILDGKDTDARTPFHFDQIRMGKHTISLIPADPKVANSIKDSTIQVSSAPAFHFNMYKTKKVTIKPNPSSADVIVTLNGQQVANKRGEVVLDSAIYGMQYDLKGIAGTDEMTTKLVVNDLTPSVYDFKIIGATPVSITAKQNNKEVMNGVVTINGQQVGYTPYSTVLDYGKYQIGVAYDGYAKTVDKKVNKKTKDILVKVPNKKTVGYNPFDIDYRQREWGLTANYVQRSFHYSANGKSVSHNFWGEAGKNSTAVQIGLSYQPYFAYGQGLSTGLYWQGTFGSVHTDEYGDVDATESALYFPLQYQFRLPLHKHFSVAVNAGAALTYGLSNKGSYDGESLDFGYGYNEQYGTIAPDALDYSLLFGVAFQWQALQVEAKYSVGLKNHKDMAEFLYDTTDAYQANPIGTVKSSFVSLGLSLMF